MGYSPTICAAISRGSRCDMWSTSRKDIDLPASCYSSVFAAAPGQFTRNVTHGIAPHPDSFVVEAGRSCSGVEQSCAIPRIQVAAVPRGTHAAAEDLSCAVVRPANHAGCMDSDCAEELSGG